jgi:hypothetical protein
MRILILFSKINCISDGTPAGNIIMCPAWQYKNAGAVPTLFSMAAALVGK